MTHSVSQAGDRSKHEVGTASVPSLRYNLLRDPLEHKITGLFGNISQHEGGLLNPKHFCFTRISLRSS